MGFERLRWVAVIGLGTVLLAGCKPAKPPGIGAKPSQLQLEPLTGDSRPVTLDDLAGKVVLINFWGTWCAPCIAELPDMAIVEETYRGRPDFMFLAVSCDPYTNEDRAELEANTLALLTGRGIAMPTYTDPGAATRLAFKQVGAFDDGYPTTLLLDRQGVIRYLWIGPARADELEAAIDELLRAP